MATQSFFMLFDRNGKPILPGSGAFRRPDWVELIYFTAGGAQGNLRQQETTFRLSFNDGAYSRILAGLVADGRHAASGMLFTTTEDGKAYVRYVLFDPLPTSFQTSDSNDGSAPFQSLEIESRLVSLTYRSPEGTVTQKTLRASE